MHANDTILGLSERKDMSNTMKLSQFCMLFNS